MTLKEFKRLKLPDQPGIYQFLGTGKTILYIGKATSLRDRVRSYFSGAAITRGRHIEEMVRISTRIRTIKTDSVLDALVLEAAMIKTHHPPYNSREKDNKSFNYVVITKELFPRVLILRERTMLLDSEKFRRGYTHLFGPFPSGGQLKGALEIVRKIFPFRDTCTPGIGKPCFNRQIGLCPGVCSREISPKGYRSQVRHIVRFFSGKKSALLLFLKKDMQRRVEALDFEHAGEIKRQIFSLKHINDALLIKDDIRGAGRQAAGRVEGREFRIEAYDIAHLGGEASVGAMAVVIDGEACPGQYRKFHIRGEGKGKANDPLNLKEILTRRLQHRDWPLPHMIVVDGNDIQKQTAERVLLAAGFSIPVVALTKDARHRPKSLTGSRDLLEQKKDILLANSEAHRFAIGFHRRTLRVARIKRRGRTLPLEGI